MPYKLKELLDKREQGLLLSLPKRAREESEEGAGAGLQLQDAGILLHVDEFSFCFLQARDRQSLFANRHRDVRVECGVVVVEGQSRGVASDVRLGCRN